MKSAHCFIKISLIFILLFFYNNAQATEPNIKDIPLEKVAPPHWWVGMKNPMVELLIHHPGIARYEVSVDSKENIGLKVKRAESLNYLFLELDLKNAKAGKFPIYFKQGRKKFKYEYELKEKSTADNRIQGITSEDFIYLIFPDRFSNGDPSNDSNPKMQQTTVNRKDLGERHGGDLQGIINHLDYIKELGATAIWLNPVLTSDQPHESYHGYATTDHYEIDPRFGGNDKYLEFINNCHKNGMKVIKDIIHNHVGDQHYIIKDLPAKDWLNQHDEFTRTTYRAPTLMDPYASNYDRNLMSNGWFDTHMPDLNQRNPQVANFLIQMNLWWIEEAGLDGFRVDTYAYPDQQFMEEWARRIRKEYPDFGIFAETWVHGTPVQAFFAENHIAGRKNFNPGVTDFQLYYALNEALTKEQGWTEGVTRIYYTLAKDYIYKNPYRNVVFLDNHDLSRFYSVIGEDINKYKQGLGFLLTTRGIPMMYYGTEILMKNFSGLHGKEAREDFPGGWKGDPVDKFTAKNRIGLEAEAFNFVKKLANYRKENPVLQTGKLMQFVPQDGVYTFFRYNDNKTVMIIMNTHAKDYTLKTDRFAERMKGFSKASEVLSGKNYTNLGEIEIKGQGILILELN